MHDFQSIVFLGDSLTDGAAWPDWIVASLRQQRMNVQAFFNAGVGGNTISQMRVRLAEDVLALQPDLAVVLAGTNDAASASIDTECFGHDFEDVVNTLHTHGAQVLLLTIPPVADAEFNARIAKLNIIIRHIAQQHDCRLVDLHEAFTEAIAHGIAVFEADGIHHSLEGWRVIARTVFPTLGGRLPVAEIVKPLPGSLSEWFISPTVDLSIDQTTDPEALEPTFSSVRRHWKPYNAVTRRQNLPWWQQSMLDRGTIFPIIDTNADENVGLFAMAKVFVRTEMRTILHVGGDPMMIWVNGEPVWQAHGSHGIHADAERLPIWLHKGVNRILVLTKSFFSVSLG